MNISPMFEKTNNTDKRDIRTSGCFMPYVLDSVMYFHLIIRLADMWTLILANDERKFHRFDNIFRVILADYSNERRSSCEVTSAAQHAKKTIYAIAALKLAKKSVERTPLSYRFYGTSIRNMPTVVND